MLLVVRGMSEFIQASGIFAA